MNAKNEALEILSKHLHSDDALANDIATALEARDKTIERLLELDKVSTKAHNQNLAEMAEMRTTIGELKAEIARLKRQLKTPLQVVSQIRFVP